MPGPRRARHNVAMTPRPGPCEQCGTPTHRRLESPTGRLLCQDCMDGLVASSAAALTGNPGIGADIGESVAIRGWLHRARGWLKPASKIRRPGKG